MTNREFIFTLSNEDFIVAINFNLYSSLSNEQKIKWLNEERLNLKPCPFCSQTHTLSVLSDLEVTPELSDSMPVSYTVICDCHRGGCGSAVGYQATKEKAIERWNRRV